MSLRPCTEPGRWIEPPQQAPEGAPRLFCLPYAGGAASLYRSWPAALPNVEVVPVQLPGRESRIAERPISQMSEMIRAITDALAPHLSTPFAVFGHSMGARLAFELTRELRRRALPAPSVVFVSACRAPHIPRVPTPPVATLPDRLFVAMLRRMNGTPPEIFDEPELLGALLPALRADFHLVDSYDYADEAALGVPIAAFGGTDDREVRENDLLAWRAHTTAAFRLRMLPGGHFVVRTAQRQMTQAIAEELQARTAGVLS